MRRWYSDCPSHCCLHPRGRLIRIGRLMAHECRTRSRRSQRRWLRACAIRILAQQAAAVRTRGLVGRANFSVERVFDRFAHHASDSAGDGRCERSGRVAPWLLAAGRPRRRSRGAYCQCHWLALVTLQHLASSDPGTAPEPRARHPHGGAPVVPRVFRGLGPLRSVAGTSSAPRRPERPSP
jgi:hypothetical protein